MGIYLLYNSLCCKPHNKLFHNYTLGEKHLSLFWLFSAWKALWYLLLRNNSKPVQLSMPLFQAELELAILFFIPILFIMILIPKTSFSVINNWAKIFHQPILITEFLMLLSSKNQPKDHRFVSKIRIVPPICSYIEQNCHLDFFNYPELPRSVCKPWHLIIHSFSKWLWIY